MGTVVIVMTCLVLLFMGAVKSKMEWMLDIVMRGIWGSIGICFINYLLAMVGISLGVGVNVLTILTTGILGIPGLLALYGIGIFQML